MKAPSAARPATGARAAALIVGLVLATAPVALAQSSSLPARRVQSLRARVLTLAARVAALRPRILSVAPQETKPNRFTVDSDVLFAFDRSSLSPDADAVLARVVQRLRNSRAGGVSIAGYTDSIGTATYNIGLSQRRAAAVEAYLQAHVHNPRLRYRTRGLGEADPVAPNVLPGGKDNPAGRQKNRRVVIAYTRG